MTSASPFAIGSERMLSKHACNRAIVSLWYVMTKETKGNVPFRVEQGVMECVNCQ